MSLVLDPVRCLCLERDSFSSPEACLTWPSLHRLFMMLVSCFLNQQGRATIDQDIMSYLPASGAEP